MERLAKLDLEHQGYIEREKLWSLEEHSSSPPLTKHAKEVDSENEAVASIRPKKTSRVKKSKKKFDGSASTTPSEMRFAGTNMASTSHAFPTQVHFSSPPIFPPSPYQQHGPATPSYALPSAYNISQYPIYPLIGAGMMDPIFYGPPPSHSQSHFAPPRTTVSNINSGNVGSVTISNVNNVNDNYGNGMVILVAHSEDSHLVLFF
jgi:hypothetical protein